MPYPTFPKTVALGFVSMTPDFASETIFMNGGGQRSIVRRTRPVRKLELSYNNHLVADIRSIVEKIEEVRGSAYPLLVRDWRHYSVTDQAFGTGDGTSAGKQLIIPFGGARPYNYPVKYLDEDAASLVVKSNGVVKALASYVEGLAIPATPWVNGETLTWSGSYYVACRLKDASYDIAVDGPSGSFAMIRGITAIEDINA